MFSPPRPGGISTSQTRAMLAPYAPSGPVARNLFLALAVLSSVYILLRAFDTGPSNRDVDHSPTMRRPARIMKVMERIEPVNELYEASLRSHDKHDRLNGYKRKVFRQRITDAYNSIPTYLLTIIVDELFEPEETRTEWLVWFSGDVVLLNPEIPLEIFLPPPGFEHVNVLATHDDQGFNAGVFFVRVDAWSVQMLTDVLACDENAQEIKKARYRHQKALDRTLRSPDFREKVIYQPRAWYNAYAQDTPPRGSLLTHFDAPGGDKWVQMDEALHKLATSPGSFSMPVGTTEYPREIEVYWELYRGAHELLPQAAPRTDEELVRTANQRLQYAMSYELDKETVMRHAVVQMKVALGLMDDGDIIS